MPTTLLPAKANWTWRMVGSGDTKDLISKLSPGQEPVTEQWAEAGTLGSLVVGMPQPSTSSLD